jgi:tetratricopeptide (TPR) repeat protein
MLSFSRSSIVAKIYLSSTYSDLKTCREAVYHALRQMRHDVIAMEDYVATDQRPTEKCLTDVATSDLYIGLFAWRYGYTPSERNSEHKSITELEYRKAFQEGKPRLIFLLNKDAPWPSTAMDAITGEGNHGKHITALRQELAQEKLVSFFKTPEHLASLVSTAIHLWEQEQKSPPITQPDFFDQRAADPGTHTQSFDHLPCHRASLVDLELGKVNEFFRRDLVQRQEDFRPEVPLQAQLVQFGMLRESYPTHGALLCFGQNPQSWLTGATTRCIYWRGNTRNSGYLDDRDCRGDLLEQFESSLNFLRKCLRFSRIIGTEGRTEQYEIPLIALQEAIANALVHREYARMNSEGYVGRTDSIQVEVFDNRLEIKSPGPLPSDMTLNMLHIEDISHPRNPLIARIFYLYGHVERVGSGIRRMQNAMEDADLQPPRFELSDAQTFKVILERPQQIPEEIQESSEFGQLLNLGLERITTKKHQSLEQIIADISTSVGTKNISLIYKWRQGQIPTPRQIAFLAQTCVQIGGMDQVWLTSFLKAANYPDPKTLIAKLYPNSFQKDSDLRFQAGFASLAGTPSIEEHQPQIEVSALPRVEGAFQGRIDELKQLGELLTSDHRPRLVTIHGSGGQGKTALAREAVERIAYAWPGGVWATTLENLPGREVFVNDLARFLGIAIQEIHDPAEIERQVLGLLNQRRTLIVLDNADTLVEAVKANDEAAIRLARFLRESLSSPSVSLLVTSREFLGWDGEVGLRRDLEGLAPEEGAKLFRQAAPQRVSDAELVLAEKLSRKVDGHPLSLRLLGGTFNESAVSLPAFVKDCELHLLQAENKYVGTEHRHRTLYACIDTSVRYLDTGLTHLFSRLWLFHASFLPETAVAIFDPEYDATKDEDSPVYDRLYTLWRRGLLVREEVTVREGALQFYRVLPTIRPYIEKYLQSVDVREQLLARFGEAYAHLVSYLYDELNRGGVAAFIAFQAREDLEQGASCVTGVTRGYYLLYWGWVLQRLVDTRRGLKLIEQALEIGQGQDRQLELQALNNMALVYRATGQPQRALELNEQALPIRREVGDRAGEAATLNNMAEVYRVTGQPQRALELYEQALPIRREVGDRAGEATTLNNMAAVYDATGQSQRALELYEQALPITREVGDRAGEAATLNNMAVVYRVTGQPQRALELYEQALPIRREVGDRAGEATTLNNMAAVYDAMGQPQRALELYEQVLPITREVGDRAGEATTLNNMAVVYDATEQSQQALELYEQALPITREVGDRAGEATTLANMAGVLYRYLNRSEEAIIKMEQAIAVLVETGLPQDSAGQTRDQLQHYLDTMHYGISPGQAVGGPATMSVTQLQVIITNTVVVMTTMQERRAELREAMENALQQVQQEGADWQIEIEFFSAVVALLDGRPPALPGDHPYAPALAKIQEGIAEGGVEDDDTPQDDDLPFDAELISLSIAALSGGPQEKMAHIQYLTAMDAQTTDEGLKELLQVIQLGLFGSDLSQLGENLSGVYLEAWEAIVVGVETGGVDPRLFAMIVQNTLAVLGPGVDQLGEWREALPQMKSQAVEGDAQEMVALLDAVIGLLDAGGNPDGLGMNLKGIYAQTWQAIVEQLA